MSLLSDHLGFVQKHTQRTGYVTDGPFGTYDHEAPKVNGRKQYVEGSVFYAVIWDDTGKEGEAYEHEIEWIPKHKRHITDSVRTCHCGPSEIDGVVVHRSSEELN